MLKIRYSSRFKKDYKTLIKRGYDVAPLEEVLNLLVEEQPLPPRFMDHALIGNYQEHRECHITPDWLPGNASWLAASGCRRAS